MKISCLLLAAALAGCSPGEREYILTGEAMGTTYRIKTTAEAGQALPAIHQMLARLDRDLSTWREDSWVAEFNRAPAGSTMEMPVSVMELLNLSKKYHVQTGGLFDPTIGALIKLWGFGAWRRNWSGEPTAAEVAAAKQASGFANLQVGGTRVTKLQDDLMLDFSAIAKGYAVDRMGKILREAGHSDFVIEFGGDILAAGNAPGKEGWTIGGTPVGKPIVLRDEALAASGSEHQFRNNHSHVVDPRSGRPVQVGSPVVAIATTGAEADALATAKLVETSTARERPE